MTVEHILRVEIGNLKAKVKSLEEAWEWTNAENHNLKCDREKLLEAVKQAFGVLVGSHAASNSVQGRAKSKLRNVLVDMGQLG
jgi:hypothetical protein